MQNRREFIGSGLGLLSALALKRKAFSGGPLVGGLRGGDCIDTGAASYDASCPMQQITNVPTKMIDGLPFASWYTGDNFPGLHHPMPNPNCFDGNSPPISEDVDVVVVGGGISGLTSAYLLRDHNPIIFEMHNQFGGAARGETWRGIPYSLGNAYVITPDPGTFLESFYQELGMNEAVRIDSDNASVELDGQILAGFFDGEGVSWNLRKAIEAYRKIVLQMANVDYPVIPLVGGSEDDWVFELDQKTFKQDIEDRMPMPIPNELAAAIQSYCYSSFAAGWEEISAAGGWNFLAAEEFDRWVCPGGNSYMAHKMWEALKQLDDDVPEPCRPYHIRGGCRVVDVRPLSGPGNKSQVTWVGTDGRCHALSAKKVVMACPKFLCKEVIHLLGVEDSAKYDAIDTLEYRGYLVANVLLDTPVRRDFYDIFLLGDGIYPMNQAEAEDDRFVCDVLNGNYAAGPAPQGQSDVLTLYFPLPFDFGRWTLLHEANWDNYSAILAPQVRRILKLLDVPDTKVKQVRMTRWGHAMPIHAQGLIANGTCEEVRRPTMNDRLFFVQQDNWALPAVENCLLDAKTYTDIIRDQL
jgi:hypothetical protein